MYFVYFVCRYCWFLLASILIIFVSVRTHEISFGLAIDELKMCIEDYLSKDSQIKIGESIGNVSKIVANRFSFQSFTSRQLSRAIEGIYYFIRTKKSFLFSDNNVPNQLKVSIREALKNCVGRRNLPRFDFEPRELAEFLDFILVDWPVTLNEMISTRNGRSTLRLYAYSASMRLISGLMRYSMNYDAFHRELLKIWMLRAHQYYNFRGNEIQYIRHRFTSDRDRMYSSVPLGDIYTIDDVNLFASRGSEDFSYRNQIFEVPNSYQFLNVFDFESSLRNGSLSESSSFSLSAAEYYLGSHIVQCYRIIIFILELQLRGISSDEDDIYDGIIPYDVVPFYVQKIVWSREAYGYYFWAWREHLQQFSSTEVQECFSREDLIMLTSFLSVQRSSKTTCTTNTSTTTATTTSTDFPDYDRGLKKGGVRITNCGKYFLPNKRFKKTFLDQEEQSGQLGRSGKYYGYITNQGDFKGPNQLDQSIYMQILTDMSFFIEELSSYLY